jgi:hypothetical protein
MYGKLTSTVSLAGIWLLLAQPALAVDTSMTYKSGWLVLGFLGVLALIVVMQLVPALILMIGFFKGLFASAGHKAEESVETVDSRMP